MSQPGPPVVPFYPFLGERVATKIDYGFGAYSNLSTGGPSQGPKRFLAF